MLLDECVPRKLRGELSAHEVKTVAKMGWAGIKNGELLRRAALAFDIFLTVDQGIPHQQSISSLPLAVLVIKARSNDIEDLRLKMPKVREILATIRHGETRQVNGD